MDPHTCCPPACSWSGKFQTIFVFISRELACCYRKSADFPIRLETLLSSLPYEQDSWTNWTGDVRCKVSDLREIFILEKRRTMKVTHAGSLAFANHKLMCRPIQLVFAVLISILVLTVALLTFLNTSRCVGRDEIRKSLNRWSWR